MLILFMFYAMYLAERKINPNEADSSEIPSNCGTQVLTIIERYVALFELRGIVVGRPASFGTISVNFGSFWSAIPAWAVHCTRTLI